ncbi:hypothetical protein ACLF9U_07340 [Helicobacter pylori]
MLKLKLYLILIQLFAYTPKTNLKTLRYNFLTFSLRDFMQDSSIQSYPPPPQSAIKDRTPNNAPSNKEIELPTHITSNLKKELRDYQKQAIHNYLEKRQSHPLKSISCLKWPPVAAKP